MVMQTLDQLQTPLPSSVRCLDCRERPRVEGRWLCTECATNRTITRCERCSNPTLSGAPICVPCYRAQEERKHPTWTPPAWATLTIDQRGLVLSKCREMRDGWNERPPCPGLDRAYLRLIAILTGETVAESWRAGK